MTTSKALIKCCAQCYALTRVGAYSFLGNLKQIFFFIFMQSDNRQGIDKCCAQYYALTREGAYSCLGNLKQIKFSSSCDVK